MSNIEWTDITRNPIKGKCPTACPYCYARELYDKNRWDPSIRFHPEVLDDIPKKPCRVFVGSTMELFLFPELLPEIFGKCRQHPDHTFIFLTKQPQELHRWSPFPGNCVVGVTATDYDMFIDACGYLGASKHEGKIKTAFVSIEPLLSWDSTDAGGFILSWLMMGDIDQLIIGAMTGQKGKLLQLQEEFYHHLKLEKLDAVSRKYTLLPRLEWVKEIVLAADAAGIPIFLKDNLYKLVMERPAEDHDLYFEDMSTLRQELPRKRVLV